MRYARYNIRNTKSGPRVTPQDAYRRSHQSRMNAGSALILAVVLTSLLAMVGVLFVMMARVNKIASSGLSENKELDSAIETVIAKISDELALDIPRKDPNGVELSEYYDYPDVKNAWLASLEPYEFGGNYYWRQISDVYNRFDSNVGLQATIVPDYQEPAKVSDSNDTDTYTADADGDGVADSKWIELADITSSRGRPIYAAIRIIDNGGMLNVNTAYKFDPTDPNAQRIDGSNQMQINLAALSQRGANDSLATAADKLQAWRCGTEPNDLSLYEQNVIWQYGSSNGAYTPFDIGDELKLRNRYILNYNLMTSRIEELWERVYDGGFDVPRTKPSQLTDPNGWFWKANNSSWDVNQYDYRHISTTYNMDRIIDPNGEKMVNINRADANSIYRAIKSALDPNFADVNDVAAQITANLIDYVDGPSYPTSDSRYDPNNNITVVYDDANIPYYGFERPCIYISELAHKFVEVPNPIPGDPNIIYRSYAIELYKPYFEDNDPNGWQIVIDNPPRIIPVSWSGTRRFHVILWENLNALLTVDFNDVEPNDPNALGYDPSQYAGASQPFDNSASAIIFDVNSTIYLERLVDDVNYIVVDSKPVPDANGGWLAIDGSAHSIQRDITRHKCIRRLWDSAEKAPTLGQHNSFEWPPDSVYIQAHPANKAFTNVGEIGMVFRKGAYYQDPANRDERIGYGSNKTEKEVRLNLADPNFQQVFNYLTVFDPNNYGWPASETRVKGRININTAPWYVIAQLPWMQYTAAGDDYQRAQAIAKNGPYENIGELMRVDEMRSLNLDGVANLNTDDPKGPDLTYDDALNDFEERDLIFARISNLVTVRSDVFTAYILVRIGTDGPQKRVIAILDRSDVYSPTDRVKILAVHPVADPR